MHQWDIPPDRLPVQSGGAGTFLSSSMPADPVAASRRELQMDVPISDVLERDPTHRQMASSGLPSAAGLTPCPRTAERAAWVGGGLLPAVVPLGWARAFGRGPTVSGNPPQWGTWRDRVHLPFGGDQPGGAAPRRATLDSGDGRGGSAAVDPRVASVLRAADPAGIRSMNIEQPVPGQGVDRRGRVEGEHLPARPRWQCRNCGHPWPCGPARSALLTEYEGSRVGLSLYLAACLHTAIEDLRHLSAPHSYGCAGLFDRFIAWTRRRAGPRWQAATGFPPLPEKRTS